MDERPPQMTPKEWLELNPAWEVERRRREDAALVREARPWADRMVDAFYKRVERGSDPWRSAPLMTVSLEDAGYEGNIPLTIPTRKKIAVLAVEELVAKGWTATIHESERAPGNYVMMVDSPKTRE